MGKKQLKINNKLNLKNLAFSFFVRSPALMFSIPKFYYRLVKPINTEKFIDLILIYLKNKI